MKQLKIAGAAGILAAALAPPASAQGRPTAAVELAAGALFFPDDGITVSEGAIGGNGRFYVSPRVSLGPEVAYIRGQDHAHLMLTGNVTVDLAPPRKRVTPFVVGG